MLARFDRMPVARPILLRFALVALAAYASRPEPASNPYGLNAELRGAPPVRTWIEPEFEQTATLSSNEAYTLYNPAELYIPDGNRLYVWDASDCSDTTKKAKLIGGERLNRRPAGNGYRVTRPTWLFSLDIEDGSYNIFQCEDTSAMQGVGT